MSSTSSSDDTIRKIDSINHDIDLEDSAQVRNTTTGFGRRDSLVRQASLDRVQNEGIKRRNTIRHRHELEKKSVLCKQLLQRLNDDGVQLIKAGVGDDIGKVNGMEEQTQLRLSMIINCSGSHFIFHRVKFELLLWGLVPHSGTPTPSIYFKRAAHIRM
ncbi:tyrosine 3-monooxygenase [Ditylenchus destructor]|nr:tyrosine 3-monooxygenase [Ditylenchus destructor]